MPGVFLSYRRKDASGYAGRLYDRLAAELGKKWVFIDVALEPGVDYQDAIARTVASCDVFLVLIGPSFAAVDATSDRARLADPDDLMRQEIEAALARDGLTVIPVLVNGAHMPAADALPASLHPLTRRNALELSDTRFDYDVDRLVGAVRRASKAPRRRDTRPAFRIPRLRWIALASAGLAAAVLVLVLMLLPQNTMVPSVVGLRSAFDAEARLTQSGLTLDPAIKQKPAGNAAAGTVIGQTPSQGEEVAKGTPVTILVAVRAGRATVPRLIGMTLTGAVRVAQSKEFFVGEVAPEDFRSTDRVTAQQPRAGTKVDPGTTIKLTMGA